MANISHMSRYHGSETYLRWGAVGSFGLHFLLAVLVLTVAWLTGVKSIEQLMKESGSLEMNPPPPDQQLEVELKDDLPPPPPTPNPEFIRQIEKPIPPPPKLVLKKPVEQPKPRPIAQVPAMVSRLVVGSGNFPKPGYPYEAELRRETGTVTLSIQFDSEGGVSDVAVSDSSGHPDLDSGARSFIRAHWRDPDFAGRAVTVPIAFEL
jgi:TonB family protein